jgi:2-keto-4-pentenoate hydratase
VGDFAEPRIEPEIVFGLGKAPSPTMDEAALLDCIDWIALGYEIVQSIFPGWKFAASDTIAANGLHGALLVGARPAIAPRKEAWRPTVAFGSRAVRRRTNSDRLKRADCGPQGPPWEGPVTAP